MVTQKSTSPTHSSHILRGQDQTRIALNVIVYIYLQAGLQMSASLHLAASIARRLGEWQAAIILALGQVTPVDQLGANWGSLLAWADVLHHRVLH